MSDSSMGKYLKINLVLMKEVLYFSFDMMKCLTCANIFFGRLSSSSWTWPVHHIE